MKSIPSHGARCAFPAFGVALILSTSANAGIIYGTGQDMALGGRDNHWKVIATPSGFTPAAGDSTSNGGYDAYIAPSAPFNWLGGQWGGPQLGFDDGGHHYWWISAKSDFGALVGGTYSYILAQQFTIEETGSYQFNFRAAGDNYLQFFIDGQVNTADALNPTITGGQLVGTAQDFLQLYNVQNTLTMTAGVHTAYMVIRDSGWYQGAMVGQSVFNAVPAPGALALLGLSGLAGRRRR